MKPARSLLFLSGFALLSLACATTDPPPAAVADQQSAVAPGKAVKRADRERRPRTRQPVPIDEDSEKRLWVRAEEEIMILNRSGLLYGDDELDAYVNSVARKLLAQSGYQNRRFRIQVIKDPLLNAFAYPNGAIYVHTGLLAAMENEAQLAALLGHELVHFLNRHVARDFSNLKVRNIRRAPLSAALGDFGEALGVISSRVSANGYSRELETEADGEGLRMAVKAGYDPREAGRYFEHLSLMIREEKIKVPLVYHDHPKIQQRIMNYEDLLAGEFKGVRGDVLQEAFQGRTMRLLLDNAELDLKRGSFLRAERNIGRYLTRKPDDARAHFLLGEAYQQDTVQGTEQAKREYQRALALDPAFPDAERALGMMLYKAGDKLSAKPHFERYLSIAAAAKDREFVELYLQECR